MTAAEAGLARAIEHVQRLMGITCVVIDPSPEDAALLAEQIARSGPGQIVALEPGEPVRFVHTEALGHIAFCCAHLGSKVNGEPAPIGASERAEMLARLQMAACLIADVPSAEVTGDGTGEAPSPLTAAGPDTLANGRPPLAGLPGA